MNNKSMLTESTGATLGIGLLLTANTAYAIGDGYVTPKTVKLVLVGASLTDTAGAGVTLLDSTAREHTFSSTDTDMAANKIGDISVPEGRYASVTVCYQTLRKIVVDGGTYHGVTIPIGTGQTNLVDGDPVYTYGTGTNTNVTKTNPGTATEVSFGETTGTCATTTFENPVCVNAAGTGCQANDTVVTKPDLYLTLNMSLAVGVRGLSNSATPGLYDSGLYPIPTLGKPGAALFLRRYSGTTVGQIALLFSPDGKLQFAQGASSGGGAIAGFCGGQNNVKGRSSMGKYEPTESQGRIQYPTNDGAEGSSGMLTITGIKQAVNSTVTISCVADAAAVPPYIGLTYTGGAGVAGSESWVIQKIVDPSGSLFATECPSGNCGTTP